MLLLEKMHIKQLGRSFCHSLMVDNRGAGDKYRIVLTLHNMGIYSAGYEWAMEHKYYQMVTKVREK